jgi:hypothetical protein
MAVMVALVEVLETQQRQPSHVRTVDQILNQVLQMQQGMDLAEALRQVTQTLLQLEAAVVEEQVVLVAMEKTAQFTEHLVMEEVILEQLMLSVAVAVEQIQLT